MTPERLFLLDGMALAYRAYFAFISRPLINSKGENTSAIYGFVTFLMKILEDEKPEHIAVVFDTKEPTFRHKMFADYKATREKMPEDMYSSLPRLKEVVRAFNVPLVEVPGFEADDVIGTLARQAEKQNVLSFLVTGDKDFMQLVSPLVKMFRPGRSAGEVEIVTEKEVQEKFGVPPHQVIDVLALIGDSSDNVPGVKGVGEKTAIPLIQKYGSIEELYNHIDEIPQRGLKEKLNTNKEMAFLSKTLVTIDTEVPLELDFHQLGAEKRDSKALMRLFADLEFKSLLDRLRNTEPFDDRPTPSPEPSAEPQSAKTTPHQYQTITTEKELKELFARLSGSKEFAFDCEISAKDPMRAELIGLSFCLSAGEAIYVPVVNELEDHVTTPELFQTDTGEPNQTTSGIPESTVLSTFKPILENKDIRKIGHNIKQGIIVFQQRGVEVRGVWFDTMIAAYVLRADGQHSLAALASEFLHYTTISFEDLIGRGKSQKDITEITLQEMSEYSCEVSDITMRVYQTQMEKLSSMALLELCQTIEFPLIEVLGRMEASGISLDIPYLKTMSESLAGKLDDLIKGIYEDAGEVFNINSTQQLGDILFKKLELPTVRKTKTGFSTDAGVLDALRHHHPIIDKLLEYRQYTKLKSTYIDALPQLVHPRTNRLHTSFNQTVAATGRLSSSDPNLQNIPIRTDLGSAIRKAFVPGAKDLLLLSADYSQIELRVMAHICRDEGLTDAFRNEEDIHTTTAAKIFGVAASEITRDMRRKAKEVNFGIMYGIGPFGLATRLEISQAEAREVIQRYFERFPGVRRYIDETIVNAKRQGYVSTLLGRRRYLPELHSRNRNIRGNAERQAINMPIQGTAADMIKLAMIKIDKEMRKQHLRSRMLLQVHDELVFEVLKSEAEVMKSLAGSAMRSAVELSVPTVVEIGIGSNWLEAH